MADERSCTGDDGKRLILDLSSVGSERGFHVAVQRWINFTQNEPVHGRMLRARNAWAAIAGYVAEGTFLVGTAYWQEGCRGG